LKFALSRYFSVQL